MPANLRIKREGLGARALAVHQVCVASPVRSMAGFSLIELIVVMVVVGILAGIVAVFIRSPMEGYMANSRRAELTDTADTALARIARDVRAALPNSLRVTQNGNVHYLEFLPIQDGGRYRAELAGDGSGDILDFTDATDAGFDVLGPAVTASVDQFLVIYNLGLDANTDAWQGGNRRTVISSGSVGNLGFSATSSSFPLESPGNRFYLVGAPVSYVCDIDNKELRRYDGYSPQASQSTSFGSAAGRLLAKHVTTCSFTYDPGASQRLGQLTLRIQISQEGETVTLYREVLVNNDA